MIEDLGYAATPQQGAPTYGAVCHTYLPFPTTTRTRELLVRRLVVPVLNKLLQLPLHPLAGAWRVWSSSG